MHVFLIVGGQGSGKTLAAEMLEEMLGGTRMSLSDVVREHATLEGLPWTRENLIGIGENVREQTELNEVFAYQTLHAFWMASMNNPECPAVIIESIRHPAEIDILLQECQVKNLPVSLLAIKLDADPLVDAEMRGRRVLARGKAGDPTTMEEFYVLNDREYYGRNVKYGLYIEGCIQYPGAISIYNHLDPENLRLQLRETVMNEANQETRLKLK